MSDIREGYIETFTAAKGSGRVKIAGKSYRFDASKLDVPGSSQAPVELRYGDRVEVGFDDSKKGDHVIEWVRPVAQS